MVGTVGAARRVGVPVAAYALGLAAGSAVVFGGLGLLGAALHPGRTALVAAAVVAAVAVALDLRGARVRPQVPFQVPERWRRTMPLPVAMLLYGLLLGTGVTTFVPAVAVWALLVFVVSLGNVWAALAVGLCFAAGRALLVRAGERALTERPGSLRLVRRLAAVSLAVAVFAGPAGAATVVASRAGDPSAAGADLAWQQPGVGGFLRTGGQTTQLPGGDPAVGGALIAWRDGDTVTVATRATLAPLFQETIVGARRLAVSDRWLAFTAVDAHGTTRLTAQSIADTSKTIPVASIRGPAQVGRPAIDGDLVVFHVATPRGSRIQSVDLATGKRARLRSATSDQLLNPVVLGPDLLYVREGRCAQQLRLGALAGGGAERVLMTLPPLAGWDLGHEKRHTKQGEHLPCRGRTRSTTTMLWTTALASGSAYVTTLRRAGSRTPTPTLLELPR